MPGHKGNLSWAKVASEGVDRETAVIEAKTAASNAEVQRLRCFWLLDSVERKESEEVKGISNEHDISWLLRCLNQLPNFEAAVKGLYKGGYFDLYEILGDVEHDIILYIKEPKPEEIMDTSPRSTESVNAHDYVLNQYINQCIKVQSKDRRHFEGTLKCVDKDNNMVLANTHEYSVPENMSTELNKKVTMQSRYLGLIVIMGRDIVQIAQRTDSDGTTRVTLPNIADNGDAMDESGMDNTGTASNMWS